MEISDFGTKKIGLETYSPVKEIPKQSAFPREQTILTLQNCLYAFATEQFKYFKDGFLADQLEESDDFPVEYVLNANLDQRSNDIALIEKISCQRKQTQNQDTLYLADFLAYQALAPMLQTVTNVDGLRLRSAATVLTYFQKTTSVRVIPYAPVVLVGIPYTCLNDKRDLLAIPHEVGHYVYRHALFGNENISAYLRSDDSFPTWIQNWFEEIFSDVYGALMAGPVLGLSFQDLQLIVRTDRFYTDDGDHPVPLLRPYIYINVIESMFQSWTDKLRSNWETYLNDKRDAKLAAKNPELLYEEVAPNVYGTTKERKILLKDQDRLYKAANIISTTNSPPKDNVTRSLDEAVKKIRDELLANITNRSWPPSLAAAPENASADNLYDHFINYLETLTVNPVPDLSIDGEMIMVGDSQTHLKVGELMRDVDEPVEREIITDKGQISKKSWLRKLDARGWATRGPDCDGSGGVNC